MSRFDDEFADVLTRLGWRDRARPAACVERWRRFADDCVAGFPWDLEDYANDITLRSALQGALESAALRQTDPRSIEALEREIGEADEVVRPVLVPGAFPQAPENEWWRRGAPRYAARRFCTEFQKAYGIEVQPRSRYDDDVDAMTRLAARWYTAADAGLLARDEGWYVGRRPELLFRAVRDAFDLDRGQRRAVWAWARGDLRDEGLRAVFRDAHGARGALGGEGGGGGGGGGGGDARPR